MDADQLCRLLGKQLFGKILAVNEMVVTSIDGVQVLCRITATDTLDPDSRAEAVGYHCYRGLVTPETQFYLTTMRQGVQPARNCRIEMLFLKGTDVPSWTAPSAANAGFVQCMKVVFSSSAELPGASNGNYVSTYHE